MIKKVLNLTVSNLKQEWLSSEIYNLTLIQNWIDIFLVRNGGEKISKNSLFDN